jgi:hypothetical protein
VYHGQLTPENRADERCSQHNQLQAETASTQRVALQPTLVRVRLADGAKDNWRLLADIERTLPPAPQPSPEIVDFYHACEHLKRGCDAAWGEGTAYGKAEFVRLKTLLKEADDGVDVVIRVLKYQHRCAKGSNKQKLLEIELTYFRNQKPRMHYADYLRRGLPITSGVMEAACKTLVTQRMKRSGMAWTMTGGQAILTLRSLIQSQRWSSAWPLLSADFRQTVTVHLPQPTPAERPASQLVGRQPTSTLSTQASYAALPLAT